MTDKKRVTIYIDGEVWESVKEAAFKASTSKNKISASQWVEGAIRGTFRRRVLEVGMKIKPPGALNSGRTIAGVEKSTLSNSEGDDPGGEPLPEDVKRHEKAEAEILAEGQKKLDAQRKGREIKKDKIASLTGHSGAVTKASQVGKKRRGQ